MPKKTYTQINSVTLAAASTSVTFSSIPGTFRDLVIVAVGRSNTVSNLRLRFRFNNDATASAYTAVTMRGEGTSPGSSAPTANTSAYVGEVAAISTEAAIWKLEIFDYAQTDKHKTALTRLSRGGGGTEAIANRWANTAAVTSINLFGNGSEPFAAGATFTLYGIEA